MPTPMIDVLAAIGSSTEDGHWRDPLALHIANESEMPTPPTTLQTLQTLQVSADIQPAIEGERIVYGTCRQNGCHSDSCILKIYVKDNVVTGIESDDTVNPNIPREDAYLPWEDIEHGLVQIRACSKGRAWRYEMYAPTRVRHPMKRVGQRGEGRFVRISWEEALDTIASKFKDIVSKYGPYSIWNEYSCIWKNTNPLAPYQGAGVVAWGDWSASGVRPARIFTLGATEYAGVDGSKFLKNIPRSTSYSDILDVFNSKLIVFWGRSPVEGELGTYPYYLMLAKEREIPILIIDPRYSLSAEALADQWIPIRPTTDETMMIAIAYVLFKEDLYDHTFVETWVEPKGFQKWREYVLGIEDGIEKGPEWAEPICGVPADTIWALARLFARSKPMKLYLGYDTARRIYGWNVARAGIYLQVMLGNLGVPGGSDPCGDTHTKSPPRGPTIPTPFNAKPGKYEPPVLFNLQAWSHVIMLREKLEKGRITKDEYNKSIGNLTDNPAPNIKMMIFESNQMNSHENINHSIEALKTVEFSWGFMWHRNQPTAQYLDVVLPGPLAFLEEPNSVWARLSSRWRWEGGIGNTIMYAERVTDPIPAVKPRDWVWYQLAERLGIADECFPRFKGVSEKDWDKKLEEIHREGYEAWASRDDVKAAWGDVPSWEEFKKKPIIRVPVKEARYAYKEDVVAGRNPFANTPSGKIEFHSEYIEKADFSKVGYGGHMFGGGNVKSGGKVHSIAKWVPHGRGTFTDPRVGEYPLLMITPNSLYRQHSCQDGNPLLNKVYRHAVWISVADAKKRGIKDGDKVRVYNQLGEIIIAAYVTSRIVPGVVAIYHGGWYRPDRKRRTKLSPDGIDTRGSCNLLTDDVNLPDDVIGTQISSALVAIEKVDT